MTANTPTNRFEAIRARFADEAIGWGSRYSADWTDAEDDVAWLIDELELFKKALALAAEDFYSVTATDAHSSALIHLQDWLEAARGGTRYDR